MFRSFFPDEYLDSAYVIDYEKLYREGYRGLLLILIIPLSRTAHRQMNGQGNCLKS